MPLDDLIGVLPLIEKLEDKEINLRKELLEDVKSLVYVALKNSNTVEKSEIGKLVDLADLQDIIKVIVGQKKAIEG